MGKSLIIKGLNASNISIGRIDGAASISYTEVADGFIDKSGNIITKYGGKHYKYNVELYTYGVIVGTIGVDANNQWAVYKVIKNNEEEDLLISTEAEYLGLKVDLSDVKEIWINCTKKSNNFLPMGFFVK